MLKILVAGDWLAEIHERAVSDAFKTLGHEPVRFGWQMYLAERGEKRFARAVGNFSRRF